MKELKKYNFYAGLVMNLNIIGRQNINYKKIYVFD
jgi:hypothetical protein